MGTPSLGGSISHMHIPHTVPFYGGNPYNFTDLNTSIKSLENVIKQNQQQQQQTQSNQQQHKQNQLYNLEAKNQNVNPLGQFVKKEYPEKYKPHEEETKSDKEEMAHNLVDKVINVALNYHQQAIDKLDKEQEVVNSDDYDEDKPLEIGHFYNMQQGHSEDEEKSLSDTTVILRGKSAKNWEKNRKRMIKNLNEGKTVKQSTRNEYNAKYNKKTGLYY